MSAPLSQGAPAADITWTEGGRLIGGEPVAEIIGECGGMRLIGRYYPKRADAAVCSGAIRDHITRILSQEWRPRMTGTYWLALVSSRHSSVDIVDRSVVTKVVPRAESALAQPA